MAIDVSMLPVLAAAFLLTFARIGTMMMLMPAIGEAAIPSRVRLAIALLLTAIMMPAHRQAYTVDLTTLGPVILMLFQELIIGGVLGVTGRLALSGLQLAGAIVANQLGLGFAMAVDPSQNQQGMLVGNFLTLLGVTMIFATDLHHLVIAAMNESYSIFKPGEMPLTGDAAHHITNVIAASFRIGVQLSAPFLAFGLIFNLGLGVLSRLMPQMQVYFVSMPLTIILGLMLLVLVMGVMMTVFTSHMESVLGQLVPRG